MDLCHCLHPNPQRTEDGVLFCARCQMWFDERQWKKDPRVRRAAFFEARKLDEAHEITDFILRRGHLIPNPKS